MGFFLSIMMVLALVTPTRGLRPNPPGMLQVYVASSDDPEYIEEWVEPPRKQPVKIDRLEALSWGGTAHVGFIVTGYALTRERRPSIEIDVKIIHPDGSVVFEQEGYAVIEKGPLRLRGFVMADPGLDLPADPGDPVGTYGILATVRDLISKKEATGGYSLIVVENADDYESLREKIENRESIEEDRDEPSAE